MTMDTAGSIVRAGLWRDNPGIVQLLGLCPLLAVSTNAVNALCLGLATMLAMTATGFVVSSLRGHIPSAVRIPAFILVIAALVTVIQLALNAYAHAIHAVLGIFIPLIVTNCLVLARVEAYASRNSPWRAALDGLSMAAGLTLALVALGALRELLSTGTLLSGLDIALGPGAKRYVVHLSKSGNVFPLAQMATGAFIGLGLLIAARNSIVRTGKAS